MKIIKTTITILRIAIGWHFLYEGAIKLFAEKWSAEPFLNSTYGFLSGFYHWLAASPARLDIVDFMNIWGLIFIGLALFTGLWSKWASIFGALLLTLYYFAYPPFGISLLGSDGSTYIINMLFIEGLILVFLFFYKEGGYGLDDLIQLLKKGSKVPKETEETLEVKEPANTRREFVKDLAAIPVLGLFGWGALRSGKKYGTDALSGATIKINQTALSELKGELPIGKIGKHELTRLVAGGNLIGGWMHARDLRYVDVLSKAYNTEKKIFETLMMCEQAGINAINIGFPTMQALAKYKKLFNSKITVIVQVAVKDKNDDIFIDVKEAIDLGMDIIQMNGGEVDRHVRDNKMDILAKWTDLVKSQGFVAGLGAHDIHSLMALEENGIIPDYYMSTMHHDDYWSAHPRENRKMFEVIGSASRDRNFFHDNLFCTFPDLTIEFINRAKIPVMGYKVLAAGAIRPEEGFNWAFENGADFICVGMFDFQVVKDVNICLDVLQNLKNRNREWYA